MKARHMLKVFLAFLVTIVLLAGCTSVAMVNVPTDSPAEPADRFELVRQAAAEYLEQDIPEAISPEVLYQEYVQAKNPQCVLVDIRANEDFVANNIRGSINIPYAQTMDLPKLENLPKEKTLVVIDYNGHWAAQTAASWNMLGFKAIPLKYGLQSWTEDPLPLGYDLFPTEPLNYPLVTTERSFSEYGLPELMMTESKAESVLRIYTKAYLDRNYKGYIEAPDLYEEMQNNFSELYLVDVRKKEHYKSGHLKGAINIPLSQLAETEMLKKLPQDKKIVLIGYDGMEASQGARILVTLGYNAVALKYGLAYWNSKQDLTGVEAIHSLVQDYFELTPLNYTQPSSGPAGCG